MAGIRYKSGPFVVDPETGEMTRDGVPLKLRPQALKVLSILIERPGELVSREELARLVWGTDTFVDFDQGLNFCIREIRKWMGDGAEEPKYIETLPRRGYRYIGPVERLEPTRRKIPNAEAPQVFVPPAKEPDSPGKGRRPNWLVPMLAILTVVVVAGAVWWFRGHTPRHRYPARLVVLPFANLTGDPNHEYLVRGVVEEITAQLGSAEPVSIAVIGRTSAEAVANRGLRLDQISKELDVDYVVEGSVRQQGDQLRITAQLIRSYDMAHVWAESYDRNAMQLFTVEQQVARNIAREVNFALGREMKPSMPKRESANPTAMDAYLKGKFAGTKYLRAINGTTYEKNPYDLYVEAEEQLTRAVELDPEFALAQAELGTLLTVRTKADLTPDPDLDRAERYALRALQLEPGLLEVHILLANIALTRDNNVAEAKRYLDQASKISPHDSQYLRALFVWELAAGKMSEAVQVAETLVQMEPMDDWAKLLLSNGCYYDGQYDRSIELNNQFLAKHPDSTAAYMYLAHAYYMKGNQRGWMETTLRVREAIIRITPGLDNPTELAHAREVFQNSGPAGYLDYIRGPGKKQFLEGPDRNVAFRYLYLGEKENAIKALSELAGQERYQRTIARAVLDPMMNQLRGDPRFDVIAQRYVSTH